jgi:glycosyltransferase involved in cell wall biosynthesis
MTSKEVIVYSIGDSNEISTWSNVPYFFCKELEENGYKVIRVNIQQNRLAKIIWDKTLGKIHKKINPDSTFSFFRSKTNYYLTKYKIIHAALKHPESKLLFFLTYSFSAKLSGRTTIQFCDWTYKHLLENRLGKIANKQEKSSIAREISQINKSNFVFSLFPKSADSIRKDTGHNKVFYVGHIINSLETPSTKNENPPKKDSPIILFIGKKHYIEGAQSLISAFSEIEKKVPDAELHIIGINEDDLPSQNSRIIFHGYLDKNIEAKKALYYQLMRNASVFVNTTPKWGSFSATVEAMHFYTPVIISPFDEFVAIFGEKINFGTYHDSSTDADGKILACKILNLINSSNYDSVSSNAHESVKDFTWDETMSKLLISINASHH